MGGKVGRIGLCGVMMVVQYGTVVMVPSQQDVESGALALKSILRVKGQICVLVTSKQAARQKKAGGVLVPVVVRVGW